jgi:hypothetical protein
MKVRELIEQLKNCDQELDVVIEDNTVSHYCGTKPSKEIGGIYQGFDWDAGRIYIIFKQIYLKKWKKRLKQIKKEKK